MDGEITHKHCLQTLSDDELLRLRKLSDRPGLIQLAGHFAGLALTSIGVFITLDSWLVWPAMLGHGILLSFLFAPLHETIHGTAFRSTWMNQVVANVCGFVLLLPPHYFRYFHFAHHRHTQDSNRDPELEFPKPDNWPSYLRQLSGVNYWRSQSRAILRLAWGRADYGFVLAGGRQKVIHEAREFLALYAVVALVMIIGQWGWPLWFWLVPAILGQPFLRAFLLAEHTGCPLVPDMLANTRTTFANRLVQRLAWNMPHHTAHHTLPVVPFHRLPNLTNLLDGRLKCTAPGYPAAHHQIRSVWRHTEP